MSSFRRCLFWAHLVAGLIAGVVIFIMSFTGAALALQPQLLLWAEREMRIVTAPSAPQRLAPNALLARVHEQRADLIPTGLTINHDPTLAAAVTLTDPAGPETDASQARQPRGASGRPPQTTLYVNPYTGRVTGQLDPTSPARRFVRTNTDWHRWLGMSGDQRATGRWMTGVANAAFLVLAITGLYLWIPRVWSWAALSAVTLFRSGLSSKAQDFNWHNVVGLWSATVLVVLTFTGMCISFPKTYDVIYAVTGIERPPASAAQGAAGSTGAAGPAGRPHEPADPPPFLRSSQSLDRAWARAEAQMPSWRSIAVRLSPRAGQPLIFTFNDRDRINPMARSTLTVDAATAQVLRWEPYEQLTTGQRVRTWIRFGHTGELWGLPGQIIAGLASAGGCLLVYTGVSLAWRRCVAWRARRARRLIGTDMRERSAA